VVLLNRRERGSPVSAIVKQRRMFVTTPQAAGVRAQRQDGRPALRYKKELPEICSSCIRPTAGWRCGATASTSLPSTPMSSPSTAKTGTVVWDTTVDDYKKGYYFTLAPLIAKVSHGRHLGR